MSKFYNADGSLTSYAFGCGYIQQREAGGRRVQLYHDGGVYHVRAYDFEEHKRLLWDSFADLTPARAAYRKACREYLQRLAG